jgi:hypothetical protein
LTLAHISYQTGINLVANPRNRIFWKIDLICSWFFLWWKTKRRFCGSVFPDQHHPMPGLKSCQASFPSGGVLRWSTPIFGEGCNQCQVLMK